MSPLPLSESVGKLLFEMCPGWASGTILLRSEAGDVVGYGHVKRTGKESAEVRVTSSPEGVRFLSASPPAAGE
jgi:hypothetical protein